MPSPSTPHPPGGPAHDVVSAMKNDWNARARENPRWYINTVKRTQSDQEFDEGGVREVEGLVVADLPFLTRGRDPRSLRLLEIGCGLGRMTRALAAHFGEVHATDVSGQMIRRARQRLNDLSNVCLYETSGLDCRPLADQSVDLVISAYVFQHVPTTEAIRSNIVDAFRVLKPGGMMKIQTMDFSSEEFARLKKDTWAGAAFTESELRQTARDIGAHVVEICGKGTQYCWTTFSKPAPLEPSPPTFVEPRVLEAGRRDDRSIRTVAIGGPDARISILVPRRSLETLDATAITVLLQGQSIEPDYVGPLDRRWSSGGDADPVELIVSVPPAVIPGAAELRVAVGGRLSPPTTLTMQAAPAQGLLITAVQNGADGGIDIEASGPKSTICIMVDGFEREPVIEWLRFRIGNSELQTRTLARVFGKGGYVAQLQLPASLAPGVHDLQVRHGEQETPVHRLEIVDRGTTTLAALTPALDDAAATRAQGLSPGHPLFSAGYYLAQNEDVARSGMDPLVHYVRSGAAEGRQPHVLFDPSWYLAQSRGAMPPGMTPLTHYITVGVHLELTPHPLFDTAFYRRQVPELDVMRVSPLAHYVTVGWRQQLDPHPLFSSAYFRERCADQLPEGMSPLEFYLSSTRAMAIDPHPWFSASYYLRSNPDVVTSGMNPLLHFVRSGVSEGRSPHPDFNLRGYRTGSHVDIRRTAGPPP